MFNRHAPRTHVLLIYASLTMPSGIEHLFDNVPARDAWSQLRGARKVREEGSADQTSLLDEPARGCLCPPSGRQQSSMRLDLSRCTVDVGLPDGGAPGHGSQVQKLRHKVFGVSCYAA